MQLIRFPQVSNRADWNVNLKNTDPNDGTLIDLSPYTITLQIRGRACSWPVLSAGTSDGKVTFPSEGIVAIRVPAAEMSALIAGTYEVGATVTDGTNTSQFILGSLPVVDGIVRS